MGSKVQRNAEKAWCNFCCCKIRAHRSDLNSHYYALGFSDKHQRNAILDTMWQHGDMLNFGFQQSFDSSRLIIGSFCICKHSCFVNSRGCGLADTCYNHYL